MMSRIHFSLAVCAAVAALLAGCGGGKSEDKSAAAQPKEVSRAVAAEAETHASDAVFAMQIRDLSRAEKGWARAVELRPDIPEWWESYGTVLKRQGKTGDARSSYKRALGLWEKRYEATSDPQYGLHQVFTLVLLDRADEARRLAERLGKLHPKEPLIRNFVDRQGMEQLLADPDMKQNKL